MNMNRRSALRTLVAVTAGVTLLPSCVQRPRKAAVAYKHLKLNGEEEDMLAAMAAIIIPATSTPGAKETGAHRFALTMIDDCCSAQEQEQFYDGLQKFEALVKQKEGSPFLKCTPAQQQQWVATLNTGKNLPDNVKAFFHLLKRYTIEGFTGSQYFLTKVKVYELVPGRFHGCIAVSKVSPATDN
jgi:hypothetical protein